jgi:hypothetical protein
MAREAKEVAKLFDKTAQIWTTLEEDEKVQLVGPTRGENQKLQCRS